MSFLRYLVMALFDSKKKKNKKKGKKDDFSIYPMH
jgi:hypothetical protein